MGLNSPVRRALVVVLLHGHGQAAHAGRGAAVEVLGLVGDDAVSPVDEVGGVGEPVAVQKRGRDAERSDRVAALCVAPFVAEDVLMVVRAELEKKSHVFR